MDDRQKQLMTSVGCLAPIQGSVRQPLTCVLVVYAVSICAVPPGSNLAPRALHPIPNQLSSSSASSIHHHLYEQMCGSRASELRCVDGYHPHGCWRCQLGQQRKGWCAACRWAQPKCTTRTGGMDRDGLQLEVIMDHDSQIVWAIN